MKTYKVKLIALLVTLLLLVSITAVSADSNGAVKCGLDITFDEHYPGEFFWMGALSDCELEGIIRFDAVFDEYFEPGKTVHFVEIFHIWPDSGGHIMGKNWGVWNLSTFKYRANGWVTYASPEWDHLMGAKYHEVGTTGNPDFLPILAPGGKMTMAPGNRQPHALP